MVDMMAISHEEEVFSAQSFVLHNIFFLRPTIENVRNLKNNFDVVKIECKNCFNKY